MGSCGSAPVVPSPDITYAVPSHPTPSQLPSPSSKPRIAFLPSRAESAVYESDGTSEECRRRNSSSSSGSNGPSKVVKAGSGNMEYRRMRRNVVLKFRVPRTRSTSLSAKYCPTDRRGDSPTMQLRGIDRCTIPQLKVEYFPDE
jgi:hypothetical protein